MNNVNNEGDEVDIPCGLYGKKRGPICQQA
jgi:hypothetical protein